MVSAFVTTLVSVYAKSLDEKESKKIIVNRFNIKVYLGKKIGAFLKTKNITKVLCFFFFLK